MIPQTNFIYNTQKHISSHMNHRCVQEPLSWSPLKKVKAADAVVLKQASDL